MYISALQGKREPKCNKGYILLKDRDGVFNRCSAKTGNQESFCICNGLLSSAGYNPVAEEPLYTVGSNAWRLDRIVSVKDLMDELIGQTSSAMVNS
jgi:nitronate monooxygenase